MLYLYALLAERWTGEAVRGLAGERVRRFEVDGLHVAAGVVRAAPSVSPDALRGHDEAVRALAMRARALLPMRFGQTVADLSALAQRVARRRVELARGLELVEGCAQLTLRFFLPAASAARDVRPVSAAAPGVGPGASYMRRLLARREERQGLPEGAEELLELLGPMVRAQRQDPPREGRQVASVHHLVPTARRVEYMARFESARRARGAPRVTLSGPWPPYAFASVLEGP